MKLRCLCDAFVNPSRLCVFAFATVRWFDGAMTLRPLRPRGSTYDGAMPLYTPCLCGEIAGVSGFACAMIQ